MSLKYVELDVSDPVEPTDEELDNMTPEERVKFITSVVDNMKRRLFLLSFAILKFGEHDKSCTDPDICSCTLSAVQELAHETVNTLEKHMKVTELTANKVN